MGEVLRKAGWSRSDLVVSTKIFWGGSPAPAGASPAHGVNDRGLSRKHIIEGTDAALQAAGSGLRGPDLLPSA